MNWLYSIFFEFIGVSWARVIRVIYIGDVGVRVIYLCSLYFLD